MTDEPGVGESTKSSAGLLEYGGREAYPGLLITIRQHGLGEPNRIGGHWSWARVRRWSKRQGTATTIPCTLESTGSYHYPVSLSLRSAGYRVNCVNPIITKKYRKATIRDAKSDKIDAQRIAEIGFLEPNLQQFDLTTDQISAKTLLTSISHVEGILQQLKAHIRYLRELKDTIGVAVPHRELDKSVVALEEYLERMQAEVCRLAPPEALLLAKAVPGLSHLQIATLLVALGDKQFESRDQLVAFVGLDVRVRQSGSWQGKQHISKRGDAYLRRTVFLIGWSLWMNNPRYQEIYTRKRAEGKNHTTCLLIVGRKFLRFLFSYYWRRNLTALEETPWRRYQRPTRKIAAPAALNTLVMPQQLSTV